MFYNNYNFRFNIEVNRNKDNNITGYIFREKRKCYTDVIEDNYHFYFNNDFTEGYFSHYGKDEYRCNTGLGYSTAGLEPLDRFLRTFFKEEEIKKEYGLNLFQLVTVDEEGITNGVLTTIGIKIDKRLAELFPRYLEYYYITAVVENKETRILLNNQVYKHFNISRVSIGYDGVSMDKVLIMNSRYLEYKLIKYGNEDTWLVCSIEPTLYNKPTGNVFLKYLETLVEDLIRLSCCGEYIVNFTKILEYNYKAIMEAVLKRSTVEFITASTFLEREYEKKSLDNVFENVIKQHSDYEKFKNNKVYKDIPDLEKKFE